MISECHAAGVKVLAGRYIVFYLHIITSFFNYNDLDTIFNHMAGINNGTGVAGDSFTQYVYPGIYEAQVR